MLTPSPPAAPAYPPNFVPAKATIFYYFNLLPKTGQFVPQLTLGNGLCNGTGPDKADATKGYRCSGCSPDPARSKQWYMQAQYFWGGYHQPNQQQPQWLGKRARTSEAPAECHVVAGDLLPVNPGEEITTTFTQDAKHVWHASISNGKNTSKVTVPFPFMQSQK